MTKLRSLPHQFFDGVIINKPRTTLVCLLAAVVCVGFGIRYFRLDASAETLVLENDKDLKYSRLIDSRYGGSDLLVVIFTPEDDLFSDSTLTVLGHLRDDLERVGDVESVLTILDVPLLESPPVPLKDIGSSPRTLESPDVDKTLARKELQASPLYYDLLVSPDLTTTTILMTFPNDLHYKDLVERRNALQEKNASGAMTPAEQDELKRVTRQFAQYHDKVRQQRHDDILAIRAIMDRYRGNGVLYLGGLSMIANDMISFIKSDLRIFGTAVFLLLVLTMAIIFRKPHWVILPTLTCLVSVVSMVGFMGWLGWEVTVISSNFISLQLIITLAMTIHLIVRYREMAAEQPLADQHTLILATLAAMWRPCVYSGLTTMMGFASLIFCTIRPVINFGYIMVVGVAISILVPFLFLPAVLALVPRDTPWSKRKSRWSLAPLMGRFTLAHGTLIIVASAALLIFNVLGIRKLEVENCFIDYFKSTTEIHRGMWILDQQLGGTTPLDVIIDFASTAPSEAIASDAAADGSDVFDQFEDFESSPETKQKYWFTPDKMERIAAVHDYLDGRPEVGKVLSVVTLVRMIERLNDGTPLDTMELALLFNQIPDKLSQMLVRPYVSVEHDQVRVAVRIKDSAPSLKRNELLKTIRADLTDRLGLAPEQVHLSGTLVLYNNMLQSLYTSQVVTMGLATLALMGTFMVLFRSLRVACIAIFPNLLAISAMLGFMGWMHIPLDMMTITIAAIGVGLAVDDTIHYIHRFKQEFATHGSYAEALRRSHGSIGHAMYYTTVTLVIGFSILSLSNFIPTIYFGLLTVLAMSAALLAALTLLPRLLVLIKPYGKEAVTSPDKKENDQ